MAHNADHDQQPLRGVVLCCTALAQDVRTGLAEIASQMGADHKLDLTAEVTHLLVGNINTPKYKYVAKERPDVRVLSPDFIKAVRDAWTEGGEVDVESLEKQYTLPTFFGLQLCLTGIEDMTTRKEMEDMITANGGAYNGDLTRQVTHLIAAKPAGQKYVYAKQWELHVVGLKWYSDCLKRGMSVDERCYLPEMPLEEQGVGAFRMVPKRVSLGKRGRDDEQTAPKTEPGRKKLRKSTSMRMNAQSQEFWQNLSANEVQVDNTTVDAWEDKSQTMKASATKLPTPETESNRPAHTRPLETPRGLFSGHAMLIHGFNDIRTGKLRKFLEPNGATIVTSTQELQQASQNAEHHRTCLVVPHDSSLTPPTTPTGTITVSQWWVERCIHFKQLLDPAVDPLSSPLSNATVAGFENLSISTTGFTGVEVLQTAQAVKLMGATYQELLSPSTSVLICASKKVKKEKAFYATKHQIPTVSPEWLWQSLRARKAEPVDQYAVKLPTVDSYEMRDSPSSSGPAPSNSHHVPPFRRSGEAPKRADDLNLKRLSNTRKRQAKAPLPLKAGRTPPREPSKANKCPFVLEDDEEEETSPPVPSEPPVLALSPDSSSLQVPSAAAQPLREVSPNTSQPKNDSNPQAAGSEVDQVEALVDRERSPDKENQQSEPTKKQDLTSELASLLHRNVDSDKPAHPPEERKRKNRPLGRNLSVISNRSNSIPGSAEVPEHISPADGFPSSREPVHLPPSTQLGYETPEAEAHRREMSKKMGFALTEEQGTRVASIGTVKDTREVAARSAATSRAKTRSRPRQ